jgi:DNA-binding transcriptional LysR family regulator
MWTLELRHLRAFVAIADHEHYGRAAESLKLTQPAITQRIQVLEQELGVQLLKRNAREVSLTSAGEALIEYARSLVRIEDQALLALKDLAAGSAGTLRLAYLTLWDTGLPADIVAEFRQRYPDVRLKMSTGYSLQNMERLRSGEVDFAFIGAAIFEQPGVAIRVLDRHEVVVVMHPDHPLAQMEVVPVERLRREPIISASSGVNPQLVAASLGWLTKATGEPPNIVREEPPDQMAGALARSRNAIGLMTEHRAILARAEGLEYRRLLPTPVIEYGCAYVRDNPSPILTNLLRTIDEITPPLPTGLGDGSEFVWVRKAS